MTKTDILDYLIRKFPVNEYALMEEVSDSTGFNRSRSADYIAVNLWPSRGNSITGIELKSFRNDWLSELKKPQKAENIFKYCDFFYLLTTDDKIAKLEEIPVNWGWMCIKGSIIKILKPAPALTPVPLTKDFTACMLKRAVSKLNYVRLDSIQDKLDAVKEQTKKENTRQVENLQRQLEEVHKLVNKFESSMGLKIEAYPWGDRSYSPEEVASALKFIKGGGIEGIRAELKQLESKSLEITQNLQNILK